MKLSYIESISVTVNPKILTTLAEFLESIKIDYPYLHQYSRLEGPPK